MEILRLCDGDVASLLELSSSERELSDLFFNISRLNDILSMAISNILHPIKSGAYIKEVTDRCEKIATVVLSPFSTVQNNGTITSSEMYFQSRCLSMSLDHFIDNCSNTEAIIAQLNFKQLCSLISLFASKKETDMIPVISDSFIMILKIIVNTNIIISNLKQTSVL